MNKKDPHIPRDTQAMLDSMPAGDREKFLEVWNLAGQKRLPRYLKTEKIRVLEAVKSSIKEPYEDNSLPFNTEAYLDGLPPAEQESLSEIWELAGSRRNSPSWKYSAAKRSEWAKIQARITPKDSKRTDTTSKQRTSKHSYSKRNTTVTGKVNPIRSQAARVYWLVAALLCIGIATWMWQQSFSTVVHTASFGEVLSVQLSDKSQIELNSGSEIHLKRGFGEGHRNVTLIGEAYFDVESSDTPFVVYTSNAQVRVLGTSFNVRSWPSAGTSETTVALSKGSVQLLSNEEPELFQHIQAGQISRVKGTRAMPELVDTQKLTEALAWRSKNIAFSSISLVEAASELERRFNISITIVGTPAAEQTVTGFYQAPEDVEVILRDLASISGLEMSKTESGYILK